MKKGTFPNAEGLSWLLFPAGEQVTGDALVR